MFETMTCGRKLTFTEVSFDDSEKSELGVIDENGEYTGLGLLFSDQCRHIIRVSVYEGTGREKLINCGEFGGSVVSQIEGVMGFIEHSDSRRLREALTAAVVQRDYAYPGELLVNVFTDRVEFMGMGALKEMDGFTRWRNEKLFAALRRLRNNAVRPAEFAGTRGAFLIVLRNEIPPSKKLIDYLREHGSISRKEAESVLGLKQTASGKILKELTDSGAVDAVGAGKNTKYVLKDG